MEFPLYKLSVSSKALCLLYDPRSLYGSLFLLRPSVPSAVQPSVISKTLCLLFGPLPPSTALYPSSAFYSSASLYPFTALYPYMALCPLYGPLSSLRPSASYMRHVSSHCLPKWWCCFAVLQKKFHQNWPFRETVEEAKRPLLLRNRKCALQNAFRQKPYTYLHIWVQSQMIFSLAFSAMIYAFGMPSVYIIKNWQWNNTQA
jgi:hypothetical protein